jgi:ribonuclease P protein component
MFPKKERLTEKEVHTLFSRGSTSDRAAAKNRYTLNSQLFSVVYKKSDAFKIGVSVQKGACHNAVERNRLRRLVYQTLRKSAPSNLSAHVFVTVKKKIDKNQDDPLRKEIEDMLKKLSSTFS